MPVIGYVINGNQADAPPQFTVAFREGLAETGFTEGRNVAIEYRWADGHSERVPTLIVGLVRRRVAVIVVSGDLPTLVAKGATGSIPIVFMAGSDPVGSGLVTSLNRPGINITGATMLAGPLGAKRLELLRELNPKTTAVGLLVNPNNPNSEPELADLDAAARTMGLQTHILKASNGEDIDKAFAYLIEHPTWGKGRQSALSAADKVRSRDQLEDREDARIDCSTTSPVRC